MLIFGQGYSSSLNVFDLLNVPGNLAFGSQYEHFEVKLKFKTMYPSSPSPIQWPCIDLWWYSFSYQICIKIFFFLSTHHNTVYNKLFWLSFSGNEKERTRTPNNTPFIGGKPASAGSPQRRGSSGFNIHARAKSEGALAIIPGERLSPPLNANQPLPPIKVPSSGEKGGGDASKNPSRMGSASGVSVINEETASQGRVSSVGIPGKNSL